MLERFMEILGLPYADAFLLAEQKALAAYFSSVLNVTNEPKPTANWILGPVKAYLNEHAIDIREFKLLPEKLARLILLVQSKKVSLTVAREKLFDLLIAFPESDPETLAGENRLLLEDDSDKLVLIGNRIIEQFPDKVAAYKSGKTGLLGFFVGKLMQETGGTSDPKQVNAVMTELLNISK
jgi:aspartyl-tRNA(Asn)/glutamyl-tRNA(Gln) amidotransferase subunit B